MTRTMEYREQREEGEWRTLTKTHHRRAEGADKERIDQVEAPEEGVEGG